MRARWFTVLPTTLLAAALVSPPGGAVGHRTVTPTATRPAASVTPQLLPAPQGNPFVPGEFYVASNVAPFAAYRVVGQGDGQTSTWTVDFTDNAARTCGGGREPNMIGIMQRDGQGPFGGHVTTVWFYGVDDDNQYVPYRALSGFEMLTCFRIVDPTIPDGTAFTITSDRLQQQSPAGAEAADGHFDLVTRSIGLGYVVSEYLPGTGWMPPAPIGGSGLDPSILELPNGGFRVFVKSDVTHTLYTADITRDRRFLGWHNQGGALLSEIYPVLTPDGQVSAFVTGTNHRIYQGRWNALGRFLGWVDLGGAPVGLLPFNGSVAAASTGGGNVTVAALDGAAHITTRSFVRGHGWGPWLDMHNVHGNGQFGIAAISPGNGAFYLYWAGTEAENFRHVLTSRLANGQWGPITDLGGSVLGLFASYRAGRTDLWAQGNPSSGPTMYQRTNVSGSWGHWHRLPYPTGYHPVAG